jgi:hypothetical protein
MFVSNAVHATLAADLAWLAANVVGKFLMTSQFVTISVSPYHLYLPAISLEVNL